MENAAPLPAGKSKSRALWFFFLLALVNLMWATQGTAVKFLEGKLGPIAITFLPFYVTTLLFVPLLVRERRRNPQAASHQPRRLAPVRRRRDRGADCGAAWHDLGHH